MTSRGRASGLVATPKKEAPGLMTDRAPLACHEAGGQLILRGEQVAAAAVI